MDIDVFVHGRFLGSILALQSISTDFDTAPLPGVDGSLGACEIVDISDDKFAPKEFGRACKHLRRLAQIMNRTFGPDIPSPERVSLERPRTSTQTRFRGHAAQSRSLRPLPALQDQVRVMTLLHREDVAGTARGDVDKLIASSQVWVPLWRMLGEPGES